ncbi:MAG TPA: N-acetylmuramoyl-L-alanine amidase, partial [Chloroflexi bacterium]|nr:N-acetylmuramoyl-L-alanine amidase [Chloroflexota bacterium]
LNNVTGAAELINTQSPGKQWLTGQKWKILLLNEINRARDLAPVTPPVTPPITPPATNATIALLQAQNAQLSAQLQQTQAAYQAANRQIIVLKQRVSQLEAELAQAKTGVGSDSDEVADLKQRIAVLEFQLSIAQETAAASAGSSLPSGVAPAVSAPPIENLVDSLPHHPGKRYPARSISAIKTLVVHHSAVPASIGAERIAQFDVNQNAWPGIGFHYFITQAGVIQQTNRLDTISYHAGGDNPTSVGIAFAGNFNAETPSQAQIDAGGHLIAWLLGHLNLPLGAMKAHKDLADTPCPGAQWKTWKNNLLQTTQGYQLSADSGVASPAAGSQTIYHYLLYKTSSDRASADKYIRKFQPTVGASVTDAMRAQYVTIAAGPQSISPQIEAQLKAKGSQVERVAGNTPQAAKALLDNMALTNRRFLTLTEK